MTTLELTIESSLGKVGVKSFKHHQPLIFDCLVKKYDCVGILNIGIKHGFSCINIRQVPWEVLKTEAEGRGFQHLARDLANANALENHVRSLLLHKKLKTFATFSVISCCLLFRLFPRCRANAISTDYVLG